MYNLFERYLSIITFVRKFNEFNSFYLFISLSINYSYRFERCANRQRRPDCEWPWSHSGRIPVARVHFGKRPTHLRRFHLQRSEHRHHSILPFWVDFFFSTGNSNQHQVNDFRVFGGGFSVKPMRLWRWRWVRLCWKHPKPMNKTSKFSPSVSTPRSTMFIKWMTWRSLMWFSFYYIHLLNNKLSVKSFKKIFSIQIKRPIVFSDTVKPIRYEELVESLHTATIAGWGVTSVC